MYREAAVPKVEMEVEEQMSLGNRLKYLTAVLEKVA